jgi:anionic cell wall polymer biosynthesis LytR-Cps2A-Psr (LCP) family protein
MKDVTGGHVSTALLVENPATRKGTILLLPDDLAVDNSDGSGTIRLDKALDAEGTGGTRDALSGLLGVQLGGSWRLDSSFLTVMVDTLGGVAVNTNATIKSKGKTVVAKGDERLNGDAAVAYATYRAKGESANAQLSRFGQVLLGVLNALPTDSSSVTSVINDMGAVPDPSLPNSRLGAALAPLAKQAQSGAVSVRTLPVMANGSLGGSAARTMVSRVLGGAIKKSRSTTGTAARVSLVDATGGSTGAKGPAALASADLTNGGFTVLPGQSRASAVAKSRVEYADASRKTVAQQVASALGLPSSAVHKVSSSMTGDVTVTLGKDFKG